MLTVARVTEWLPQIAEWDRGLREALVLALGRLNGCTAPEPDLAALIGAIIICCEDHEPNVRILRKTDCANEARANGVDEETIAAILSPAVPGGLDVFVFAGQYELVFSLPITDPSFTVLGTVH